MADTRYRLLGFIVAGTLLGASAASLVAAQPDEDAQDRQLMDDRADHAAEQGDAEAPQSDEPDAQLDVAIAARASPGRLSTVCNVGNGYGCQVRASRVGAPCQCGSQPGVITPQ